MKKSLISIMLAIVLLVGILPGVSWAEGTGSISTAKEFAAMEPSGSYVLTADITISKPYGDYDKQFTGVFDGGGHTITLAISGADNYQGLFGYIGAGSSIRNVKTIGYVNSSGNMTGAIAGYSKGTIENCRNAASITGKQYTGGIVGQSYGAAANKTSIIKCANSGDISGSKYVAGIVGKNAFGSISNCYNTGRVSASVSSTARVGGIAGDASSGGDSSINACYNIGAIQSTGSGTATQYGAVIGFLNTSYTVLACYYDANSYAVGVGYNPPETGINTIESRESLLSGLNSDGNNAWLADTANINNGYPILAWQADTAPVTVPVVSVSIDGAARSGKNLTAQARGAENKAATGVKYQWQAASNKDGEYSDISDAVSQAFALSDEYIGKYIRVAVTGDEASSAVSEAIGPVLISETDAVKADLAAISGIPVAVRENMQLSLPSTGNNGSSIIWSSDNKAVITDSGAVTLPQTDNAAVKLKATAVCGGASEEKDFDILVYSRASLEEEKNDDSKYLSNAISTLEWFNLKPVYGADTNVCTLLKETLKRNGYGELAVSIKSVVGSDETARIAPDGKITYFYSNPSDNQTNNPKQIKVSFLLTKNNKSILYDDIAVIGWDEARVNSYLNDEIFSHIEIPQATSESFDLPKYLTGDSGRKAWVELSYAVSDESAMTISKEKQQSGADAFYNPYVAAVKPIAADKTITLTAKASFNRSSPAIVIEKPYKITVKSNPEAAAKLQKELQDKLNAGFEVKGLKDYVSGETLTVQNGAYSAVNDIQLPTTRDFGVDGKYQPISLSSSDKNVLVTPGVNNAARVYVYRPLPGKEAKSAVLTVTLTDKASGISASKEFTISVQPLTQEEINGEIALMNQVKARYFDGIKNANESRDSVTSDLRPFQEAYINNGTLTWVYDSKSLANHGIVPVAMDGWETLEQWRAFRSSNAAVISHENLLVNRQAESKAVTITSYLSSETLGKYAEKYPLNKDFQKLYYQPATVSLVVSGTNPTASAPVEEKLSVGFALQSSKGTWIAKKTVNNLNEGSTVFDVFTSVLSENGYSYSARGSYVYSITNPNGDALSELDEGTGSGWMYKVNGVIPSSYMAAYPLKNGDNVVVFFTKDYTQEPGYADWGKPDKDTQTAGSITPAVTAQNGKADVSVSSDAVTSSIAKNNGKVVIAPEITGEASSVSVSLAATSVKEIAENASGNLSFETNCGSVSIPNTTLNSICRQTSGRDIKMTVESMSATDVSLPAEDIKNAVIVSVSISSENKNITSFDGGSLSVLIPFAGDYKEGERHKVIVISADGTSEVLPGKVVKTDGKAFVEVSVTHLSTFVATGLSVKGYNDVKNDAWYYDAVEYASLNGLMTGVYENTFAPETQISRAMLVTMLYRMAGSPAVTAKSSFEDVKDSTLWYYNAVVWASEKGIADGYGNGSFGVNDSITREQMSAFFYRYAKYKGCNVSVGEETNILSYSDSAQISDWAYPSLQWAIGAGIINGTGANTLSPLGTAQRCEAAAVITRFVKM